MAGITAIAQSSEIALTAATAKTVLQVVAAANHKIKILRWGVFFDGTSATAEPVQVRLLRQTDAGTTSALTPTKQTTDSETLQTTARHTATAEPTGSDVLDICEVHPQSGYEVVLTPDNYIWAAGGGRIGIECTAPAGVNVRAKIVFEE